MRTRTKSTLVLMATLVVGILLGALGTGFLLNQRLDRLQALRRPGGLPMMIENVIQPIDEAQHRQIREILERSEERMLAIRSAFGDELLDEREALRQELAPILSEEQIARMDRWAQRDRPGRGRRGRRGPPGPDRGAPPPGGP